MATPNEIGKIDNTHGDDQKVYSAIMDDSAPWERWTYVEIDEDLDQKFEDARFAVSLASTVFSYVIPYVTYRFSPDVEAACAIVNDDLNLIVFNPEWFRKLVSINARGHILLHELLHIFMFHVARCRESKYHPTLWNYATDYFINMTLQGAYRDGETIKYNPRYTEYVGVDYSKSIVLGNRPFVPLINYDYLDMTPDEIYTVLYMSLPQRIKDAMEEENRGRGRGRDEGGKDVTRFVHTGKGPADNPDGGGDGGGDSDQKDQEGDGNGGGGQPNGGNQKEGEGGGGGGERSQNQDQDPSGEDEGEGEDGESVDDMLEEFFGEKPHDDLMGNGGSDDQKRKNQQTLTAAVSFAEQSSNGVGSNEGNVVRMLDEFNAPQITWQDAIQENILNNSGDEYITYSRYNPLNNEEDGIILPSTYSRTIDVLIQADTSGSMGTEDYKDVIGEAYGLLEQFVSWRLTLATCDINHHILGSYSSIDGDDFESIDFSLPGGGGTILTPMIQYAEDEMLDGRDLTANIILTDGEFNPNELVDFRKDEHWNANHIIVITRGGNKKFAIDHPNFTVIHLESLNRWNI